MFTVFHKDDAVYTDISLKMSNYLTEGYTLPLVAAEDKLYIGYDKPFKNPYIGLNTLNTNSGTITAKYHTSSGLTDLTINDYTQHLSTRGFIKFDRPSDWIEGDINGVSKYWVELTFSADLSLTTELSGIGIIFADDTDLLEGASNMTKYLSGDSSFIRYHQSVRNEIIQHIRSKHRVFSI